MATNKPRFSISLNEDLFAYVEDYRHDNHISTRSKAVVKLLEKGIAIPNAQETEEENAPSQRDEALLAAFHKLDEVGRGMVKGYTDALVQSVEHVLFKADTDKVG